MVFYEHKRTSTVFCHVINYKKERLIHLVQMQIILLLHYSSSEFLWVFYVSIKTGPHKTDKPLKKKN